jgi:hypothetical protein
LTGAERGRRALGTRAEAFGARFGARRPRLSLVICGILLLGLLAACSAQLSYGAYLDPGWAIAMWTGAAVAIALNATAWNSAVRHGPPSRRLQIAWLVLTLLAGSSLGYPFPHGHYGRVQAFFNVVHAALLAYEGTTCAAIVTLLAYVLVRVRGRRPGRAALQQPSVAPAERYELPGNAALLPGRLMPATHGWPTRVLAGGAAGLVAGISLAAVNGRTSDATSTAAGLVILLALGALCIAGSAILYRRYRSSRARATKPAQRGNWH